MGLEVNYFQNKALRSCCMKKAFNSKHSVLESVCMRTVRFLLGPNEAKITYSNSTNSHHTARELSLIWIWTFIRVTTYPFKHRFHPEKNKVKYYGKRQFVAYFSLRMGLEVNYFQNKALRSCCMKKAFNSKHSVLESVCMRTCLFYILAHCC